MKNSYELLTIIKPNLDMEEVDKIVAKLEEYITSLDGKVNSTDKMGRKKLAYDIDKYRDGFYVVQTIELPSDKVKVLKNNLKLNENYLRSLIIELSHVKQPV